MSLLIRDAFASAPSATQTGTVAPAPGTADISTSEMLLDNLTLLAALFAIFYFILIRPQQKRIKAHRDLLGGLSKGNKVITNGGLIGTISKFEGDDVVVIEIAQNVRVRVAKAAIAEVTTDKGTPSDSANDN